MAARRRTVQVLVTLSLAPGVTKAEAERELRARVNQSCGYYEHIDERDVRVRRIANP